MVAKIVIPFRPLRNRRRPTAADRLAAYLHFWTHSLEQLSTYIATLTETERQTFMSDLTSSIQTPSLQ